MGTIKRIHPRYGSVKIIVKEGDKYYSLYDMADILGHSVYWIKDHCSFKMAWENPDWKPEEVPDGYLYIHELDAMAFSNLSPDEKRDEWLFGKEKDDKDITNSDTLENNNKGEVENMNDVQLFQNEEFGQVRVLTINGEPWFVGKDVAEMLGYQNTRDAIWRYVDEREKRDDVEILDATGREQKSIVINESGLYALIFSSKLPKAKEFRIWVTSDVLPSIRKHGAYMTDEKLDEIANNPDLLIKLATKLKEEREARKAAESKLEIAAPKAEYYDEVLQSEALVPITTIAKDYGWSAMKMNHYLENRKIQYRTGRQWVLYQKYADKGYTMSRTFTDGAYLNVQTYWTQKGRKFIYDLLANEEIFPNKVND